MMPALLVPSVRPVAVLRGTPLTGFVGDTQQLTLRQYIISGGYSDAGAGVSWSTSNASIATVSGSGLVTFVGVGSATITATVNGTGYSAGVAPVAAMALTAEHWTIEDQMFPRTLTGTFTPEANAYRRIFNAGEGVYGRSRRVVQSPADWQTGPVAFNLQNGNGWADGGDLGADAAHHQLHWHRFTGGASMFSFSQILVGYDLERRDSLPPHTFAGFWIRGVEGAQVTVQLRPSNDNAGAHIAATMNVTLHATEQYVAFEGDIPGIDNATMLSGLNLGIWLFPKDGTEATKFQGGGHLEVLGCIAHFNEAPADLLTNPAALDRYRLLKPTATAISGGVSSGGMSLPIHPTRGLWIGQSVKNHLPDGTDVGQGSQFGASSWTIASTATTGPESYLSGDVWHRWTIAAGGALQTTATFTLDISSGAASAAAGVYAWVHLLLKQDGANALPADGALNAQLFAPGPVGTATFSKYTQESVDGTTWHYRARVLVSGANAGTAFTLIMQNVSGASVQVLASRVGVEREAYITLSPTTSRDAGAYAMAAIQRPFTVTGLGVDPIYSLARHRYDDAINILSTAGGAMMYRWWCDWDVPTLRAAAVADVITVGRKLCDAGTGGSSDSSIIVLIGSQLNLSNKTQICAQCVFFQAGGFKQHTITWALPDNAITKGAFNDIATYWSGTRFSALYINGVWYDNLSASLISDSFLDGTAWDLIHGLYIGQDRDDAAVMNAYLRAFAATKATVARGQVEAYFTKLTRLGVGSR